MGAKIEAKTQLPPQEVCGELNEYKREEQRLAKQRKCMAVLRNNHTCRSSNSFNERFAIFLDSWLTLALHMDNWPKSMSHTY